MPKQFSGLGISLLYPDSWNLAEEPTQEIRQAISLESPGGSFLSINLLGQDEDADEAVIEAAEAMEAEYEDVESEPFEVDIAGGHFEGMVQRFVYLDFVIVSKLLVIDTNDKLYLIQIQGEDRDMEQQAIIFDAILTSMVRSLSEASS